MNVPADSPTSARSWIPSSDAVPTSASKENLETLPRSRSDTRGCVSPSASAARTWVHPRSVICFSIAIISSDRTRRFSASGGVSAMSFQTLTVRPCARRLPTRPVPLALVPGLYPAKTGMETRPRGRRIRHRRLTTERCSCGGSLVAFHVPPTLALPAAVDAVRPLLELLADASAPHADEQTPPTGERVPFIGGGLVLTAHQSTVTRAEPGRNGITPGRSIRTIAESGPHWNLLRLKWPIDYGAYRFGGESVRRHVPDLASRRGSDHVRVRHRSTS